MSIGTGTEIKVPYELLGGRQRIYAMTSTDPFSCFGDDDDDDDDNDEVGRDNDATQRVNENENEVVVDEKQTFRDPSCGILAFHAGTELALLRHVEIQLSSFLQEEQQSRQEQEQEQRQQQRHHHHLQSIIQKSQLVLNNIDDFCMKRHWMMHVGNEKATILETFISDWIGSIPTKTSKNDTTMTKQQQKTLNVVELGTYCGYSSILIAKILFQKQQQEQQQLGCDSDRCFKICTVEVVHQHVTIAQQLINLAGLQDYITIILFDPIHEQLEEAVKSQFDADHQSTTTIDNSSNMNSYIDFLFIDHDKDLYLNDLQRLEKSGMIKKDCHVAADNVLFAKIDNYRQYMKDLSMKGYVSTKLVESWLEYSTPDFIKDDDDDNGDVSKNDVFKDGIGT